MIDAKSSSRADAGSGATAGYQTLTGNVRDGLPGCAALVGVGRDASTTVNEVIPTGNTPPSMGDGSSESAFGFDDEQEETTPISKETLRPSASGTLKILNKRATERL